MDGVTVGVTVGVSEGVGVCVILGVTVGVTDGVIDGVTVLVGVTVRVTDGVGDGGRHPVPQDAPCVTTPSSKLPKQPGQNVTVLRPAQTSFTASHTDVCAHCPVEQLK